MLREVELAIEDIAFGGKGVGRVEGKAIFVPFTIEGERVTARVVREKKSFAEAEVVRLLEPSPQRVAPQCPYFGRCGGCAYQHIAYQHQLHWKARQIEQALQRIGKFREPPMHPIVPSPHQYSYRNRITVHVEHGVIGFFRRDAHQLIDIERCPISAPEVNERLAQLRASRPRDGHYTLRAHSGPRVFSQTNDDVATRLADAIAAFIPPNQSLLIDTYCGAGFFAKRLRAKFPRIIGIDWDIHAIAVLIPPNQTLLIDAYCGAGFFAKRLREKFPRIIGIDWDIHAIAAAQENATETETYLAGDITGHLREQLSHANLSLTSITVDPPATGLSADVREILRTYPAATLLYVSCNPPSLARDLADLSTTFALRSVTPFDMFPQTAEIEVLAHLSPLDRH